MDFALKWKENIGWKKPNWVYTYNIVKSSGKLATSDTPTDQVISTLMAVKFDKYDDWLKEVEIDSLCNGPVAENTPPEAIKKYTFLAQNQLLMDMTQHGLLVFRCHK